MQELQFQGDCQMLTLNSEGKTKVLLASSQQRILLLCAARVFGFGACVISLNGCYGHQQIIST